MENFFFEISAGQVQDVNESVPRKLELGMKYIIKGGDNVMFSKTEDGITVTRSRGTAVRISELITIDGVYLLTTVHVEAIAKLNVKYRKLYGMLRENFGEDFYLHEDKGMTAPFSIQLNLEIDIVMKYRFDIAVNTDLLTPNDIREIKNLIDEALLLDLSILTRFSVKPLLISVTDVMINELKRLIQVSKSKLAV